MAGTLNRIHPGDREHDCIPQQPLATFIRTVVILGVTALLVTARGAWKVAAGGLLIAAGAVLLAL